MTKNAIFGLTKDKRREAKAQRETLYTHYTLRLKPLKWSECKTNLPSLSQSPAT